MKLPLSLLSGFAIGLAAVLGAAEPSAAVLHSVGSDAMEGVMKRWGGLYAESHPGAALAVANSNPSVGLRAIAEGRAEFCPSGRLAWPEEIKEFTDVTGYEPLRVTVARCTIDSKELPHPHAVFVAESNPLARLTLTQVDAIFSRSRRRGAPDDIVTWGQLGMAGEWASQPIHLYGVAGSKGPAHFFSECALLGGPFKASVVELPGEEDVLGRLAKDRYGIAYTGLPYSQPGVKRLALAEREGEPYYSGSPADVVSDRYPLDRVIYISVNRQPGAPLAEPVREFLRLALSPAGQRAAAVDGYLPLSPRQTAEELARIGASAE